MKDYDVFLALVRAGLWEQDVQLLQFGKIDFSALLQVAGEQAVVGLVAAGVEHVSDTKIPKQDLLQFIGQTLQMEQRNNAMNYFIGVLVDQMRREGIYTILVKGQGIAQCYERPLWRSSGDVDFLLSKDNYDKAKAFLLPLSSGQKDEECYSKHLGITIDPWYVEIHGSLRSGLSARVDKEIDEVQKSVFFLGNVRPWANEKTQVFLPGVDDDIFFVFTHYIKHFYKEGMNLRQICDWCRLLWTYRGKIDVGLLEKRLQRSGLMYEWKAFAALAVDYLGMPIGAMPFYSGDVKWREKAEKIVYYILRGFTGKKYKDAYLLFKIFPWNTFFFLPGIFLNVNWLKLRERMFNI